MKNQSFTGPGAHCPQTGELDQLQQTIPCTLLEALEHNNDGILLVNPELKITYVNSCAVAITKRSKCTLLGTSLPEQFPEYVTPEVVALYKGIMQSGQPIEFQQSSEDCIVRVSVRPSCDGLVFYYRDITAQVKGEEERNLLALIARETINSIIVTDLEGRITWVNEAFTRITGYSFEEAVGQMPGPLLACPQKNRDTKQFLDGKIKAGESFRLEIENGRKDGTTFWWEVYFQPLYDKDGTIEGFFSVNTDITEKKQFERQLDRERDAFRRQITAAAVQGQEKERSQVSRELHDNVNQVLTTIKLYTELCAAGSVDASEVLPRCTALLNETISEIRDLSKRLSAPSLGDIGLKETMAELVESVRSTKKVDIQLDTTGVINDRINADLHLAVYRIVQEGLTNILKHADAKQVDISLRVCDKELVLRIQDDGQGFDTRKKRTGIGLTNIISRAEILDGTIEFISAPGQGTTLSASFPLQAAPITEPANS